MGSRLAALRSLAFHAILYPYLIITMIVGLPAMLLPRKTVMALCQLWCRSAMALHRALVGVRYDWRGRERVPSGALLVAAKHQSAWETFALVPQFDDPAFVLKRELMWIPLFGWWLMKMRMIPVDRGKGSDALMAMTRAAAAAVAEGRQVLIFPEGTRREPGAPPLYKFGIARLYGALGCPCLPVALNSGLVWPRRRMVQRSGTVIVEFLRPLPPGLGPRTFFRTLQDELEAACDRLLVEGAAGFGDELSPTTRERLAALAAAPAPAAPSSG